MKTKVVQFQVLSAKGKLWKFENEIGGYSFSYIENMIIYLFNNGEMQCDPLFDYRDLEPLEDEGYFIDVLESCDFDLENIMKMDECNLEDAKKQMLELIKQSGIRCTDAALKKLEI